jgi:ribonuclease HI
LSEGEAVIETDGASRGNPGKAGAGFILSRNGEIISKGNRHLGISTNNVAEYTGMIMGLEEALELGERRLLALTDSLLVVRQLNGEYRVKKTHLKPLHRRCLDLISKFDSFRVEHVPSNRNRAHALAERATEDSPGKMI